MPEESEKRRRWRRLGKGLLGPAAFGQRESPSALTNLRKRIFVGAVLWVAGVVLLGAVLGDSPVITVFALVGWVFLFALTIRYFLLFFKKGE